MIYNEIHIPLRQKLKRSTFSLISNGILPAANSMFAPNGKLIRGIHIHLMWELQELEGVEEDTNARD